MTPEEKDAIRRFASGENSLRATAIEVYRKYLRVKAIREESDEMKFMSEIDNPCPCHILKGVYRKRLAESEI